MKTTPSGAGTAARGIATPGNRTSGVAAFGLAAFVVLAATSTTASAGEYTTRAGQRLVGVMQVTRTTETHTLVEIARHFDLGYNEITAANRGVDVWLPGAGKRLILPTRFILPDAPMRGVVINLPEMRLYSYRGSDDDDVGDGGEIRVVTHPIGIGTIDWETPVLASFVSEKREKPQWVVPAAIREEYAAKGEELPEVVPAGPYNPLGDFAMRLGDTGYLIHGTNRPGGIGMRVSHGCIRLYPEDIAPLFAATATGTQVTIINQPVKAALADDRLYLEVHAALRKDESQVPLDLAREASRAIMSAVGHVSVLVDWPRVHDLLEARDGVPQVVGRVGERQRRASWFLIAGAYDTRESAQQVVGKLAERRLQARIWQVAGRHQVEVGPFPDREQASYAKEEIRRRTGIIALAIPPADAAGRSAGS